MKECQDDVWALNPSAFGTANGLPSGGFGKRGGPAPATNDQDVGFVLMYNGTKSSHWVQPHGTKSRRTSSKPNHEASLRKSMLRLEGNLT